MYPRNPKKIKFMRIFSLLGFAGEGASNKSGIVENSDFRFFHSLYLANFHIEGRNCDATVLVTRKPSCRKGYARQRHHSKMAASCHLGFYRTATSAIRFADPENHNLEPNVEWIGCTVCDLFAFKLYCDLETGVRGHLRSSKAAPFDRAHTIYIRFPY